MQLVLHVYYTVHSWAKGWSIAGQRRVGGRSAAQGRCPGRLGASSRGGLGQRRLVSQPPPDGRRPGPGGAPPEPGWRALPAQPWRPEQQCQPRHQRADGQAAAAALRAVRHGRHAAADQQVGQMTFSANAAWANPAALRFCSVRMACPAALHPPPAGWAARCQPGLAMASCRRRRRLQRSSPPCPSWLSPSWAWRAWGAAWRWQPQPAPLQPSSRRLRHPQHASPRRSARTAECTFRPPRPAWTPLTMTAAVAAAAQTTAIATPTRRGRAPAPSVGPPVTPAAAGGRRRPCSLTSLRASPSLVTWRKTWSGWRRWRRRRRRRGRCGGLAMGER